MNPRLDSSQREFLLAERNGDPFYFDGRWRFSLFSGFRRLGPECQRQPWRETMDVRPGGPIFH